MSWTLDDRMRELASEPFDRFFAQFTPKMQAMYPEAFERLADRPLQNYMLPHERRGLAEEILLSVAGSVGLEARLIANRSNDKHVLLLRDPVAVTISRTRSPNHAPRPSNARSMYAGYGSVGQYPLRFVGEQPQEPLQVRPDASAIYAVLGHGPTKTLRDIGFLWANFMAPGGRSYIGPGIDLLEKYGHRDEDNGTAAGPSQPPPITVR